MLWPGFHLGSGCRESTVIVNLDITNAFGALCARLVLDVISGKTSRDYACGINANEDFGLFKLTRSYEKHVFDRGPFFFQVKPDFQGPLTCWSRALKSMGRLWACTDTYTGASTGPVLSQHSAVCRETWSSHRWFRSLPSDDFFYKSTRDMFRHVSTVESSSWWYRLVCDNASNVHTYTQ